MAHWREEYLAALTVRDQREKANVALYDAYAQLADRTSKPVAAGINVSPAISQTGAHNAVPSALVAPSTKQRVGKPAPPPTDLLDITRAELLEAQHSRSILQKQVYQLDIETKKLQEKSTRETKLVKRLEREKTHLEQRLKDRDQELTGKDKLMDDFQNEIATFDLQLNMAEERARKLEKENKDLVDRWMARMGQEAEAMNDASQFS